MTPKPIRPCGFEILYMFDDVADDRHRAAFFSGYCGYSIRPKQFLTLKEALHEEDRDMNPGPRSIYARITRGKWGVHHYKPEDFAGLGSEQEEVMQSLVEIAIDQMDYDKVSGERAELAEAYLSGWAEAGNFFESPVFAYYKAMEYVNIVFGDEK